jgi:hypothetical protein
MGKNYLLNAEMGTLGADFDTGNAAPNILHIQAVTFPQYRFEWHPNSGVVYVIRVGSPPEIAEPIMDRIVDQTTAEKVVQIWCQGYQSGEHGRILGQSPNFPLNNFIY